MATIQLSNPTYYRKGETGGYSSVIGNEDPETNRVARFEFTSPSIGANHVSFSIFYGYLMSQSSKKTMRFYIGTSPVSHANAWRTSAYHGEVKTSVNADQYTFSGEADLLLLPDTKYYLWIFPGETDDGWCYYGLVLNVSTIETAGQSVYSLSISQGTGSSISVKRNGTALSNGATLAPGDVLTISFGAETGYNLVVHTVNGNAFASGGTHTVEGNVSVAATAAPLSVRIGTGSGTEQYFIYIGTGNGVELYAAYIGTGDGVEPYPGY